MLSRIGAGALSVLLFSATLAACGSSTTSQSAQAKTHATTAAPLAVSLMVDPGVSYTWLPTLATSAGFFKKNDIDATDVPSLASGSVDMGALASGRVDVVLAGLSLAGPFMEKGIHMTVISGASKAFWNLVSPASEPLPQSFPADIRALRGKAIGVVALGTSSYYYARALVEAAGLPVNSVTYEALGPPINDVSAIQAGRVAAAMVTPDLGYLLVSRMHQRLLFNFGDVAQLHQAGGALGSIDGDSSYLFSLTSWVDQHKAAVHRMQLALMEADVWIHNPKNLPEVAKMLEAAKDIPSTIPASSVDSYVAGILPGVVSYVPKGVNAAHAHFWVSEGLLKTYMPPSQWFFSGIARSESAVLKEVRAAGQGDLGNSA